METKDLKAAPVKSIEVTRVEGSMEQPFIDAVSVEEPLEISIAYGPETARIRKNISVTMRTPGNDPELAAGFLFTEGIISSYRQIKVIKQEGLPGSGQKQNSILAELAEHAAPHLAQSDRNFYTTSSCGVCGKGSIEAIKTVSPFTGDARLPLSIAAGVLYQLPKALRAAQDNFSATGGIHASGLFDTDGNLCLLREDVGRHNALDKLIGWAFMEDRLPLNKQLLLLSGRASFELIQKAAMAGITMVAAIGAPSSLAVELAQEADISLFGFLKENRFNIYHLSKHHAIPEPG